MNEPGSFGGLQTHTSASRDTRSAHGTSRRTRPLSPKLRTLASSKRWKKGTRMTLAEAVAYAATAEPPNRSVVRPPRAG